jgi:hypothetical protein
MVNAVSLSQKPGVTVVNFALSGRKDKKLPWYMGKITGCGSVL